MFFSVGGFEILAIVAATLPAIVSHFRGGPNTRRYLALPLCSLAAACITPADLASMLVITAVLVTVFVLGLRIGAARPQTTN